MHHLLTKKSLATVGLVTLIPGALFVVGYVRTDATPIQLVTALAFIVAVAAVSGLTFAVDRKFWFTGIVMGLIVGGTFAADLLFEVAFQQQFFVATATMAFFVILGFMLGSVAEFIHFLHHLVHGGKVEHCVTDLGEDEPPPVEKKTASR